VIESLNNYDWAMIFKMCCGEPNDSYLGSGPDTPPISPVMGQSTSVSHFTREDVVKVIAQADGEKDGPDWLGLFELKDGRFAFVSAGCGYTGWDCQGNSGTCYTGDDLETMIRLALGDEARSRLGLEIA
jgi:hypothetical protein